MSYYPSDLEELKKIVNERKIKLKVEETIPNLLDALNEYDYYDEFTKEDLIKVCQRQPGSICDSKSNVNKMSKEEIINGIIYVSKTMKQLQTIAKKRNLPRITDLNRAQLLSRLKIYDHMDFGRTDMELYQICEKK